MLSRVFTPGQVKVFLNAKKDPSVQPRYLECNWVRISEYFIALTNSKYYKKVGFIIRFLTRSFTVLLILGEKMEIT